MSVFCVGCGKEKRQFEDSKRKLCFACSKSSKKAVFIPLIYRVFYKKLSDYQGKKMPRRVFRIRLNDFHIPQEYWFAVLCEMEGYGLLENTTWSSIFVKKSAKVSV